MRKGYNGYQIITVLSNKGANGSSYTLSLGNTGFSDGEELVEIISCSATTVDSSDNIAVPMSQGLPRVSFITMFSSHARFMSN